MQEQELSDALGDCHNLETVEQIVSGEVRIFMQANMRDLEDEMIAWTSRYNEEIEQVQQEIKNMKVLLLIYKEESTKRISKTMLLFIGESRAAEIGSAKTVRAARRTSDFFEPMLHGERTSGERSRTVESCKQRCYYDTKFVERIHGET